MTRQTKQTAQTNRTDRQRTRHNRQKASRKKTTFESGGSAQFVGLLQGPSRFQRGASWWGQKIEFHHEALQGSAKSFPTETSVNDSIKSKGFSNLERWHASSWCVPWVQLHLPWSLLSTTKRNIHVCSVCMQGPMESRSATKCKKSWVFPKIGKIRRPLRGAEIFII